MIAAGVILGILMLAFIIYLGMAQQRTHQQHMADAARALGLSAKGSFLKGPEMSGSIGGRAVSARTYSPNRKGHSRFQVETRLPRHIRIQRAGLASTLGLKGPDVSLGQPELDQALELAGDPFELVALLGSDVRPRLVDFIKDGGSLVDGQLTLQVRFQRGSTALIERVRNMLALAEALEGGGTSTEERLQHIFQTDPVTKVRVRAAQVLLERGVGVDPSSASAAVLSVSRQVLGEAHWLDDTPKLVVLAARRLGAEGISSLLAVATREDVASAVRAQALTGLASVISSPGGKRPDGLWVPTVNQLAIEGPNSVRAAALRCLLDLERPPAPEVTLALWREQAGPSRLLLAECLVACRQQVGEAQLLPLINADDPEATATLLGVLGRVGTRRAVETLLPLTQGLLANAVIKQAAREALEAIRARLGEVDEGRLSILQGAGVGGELSPAQTEGELSVENPAADETVEAAEAAAVAERGSR